MEQEAFEEAIKGYAKRKESVIPEYEINLHTKRKVIDIKTQAEKIAKINAAAINARSINTPLGTFKSVRAAADAHGKSIQWIYNQIHKGVGFTYDKQG